MFNWRHHHQDYPANREAPASLVDYLAIRLLLDRMNMEHLTRHIWGIGAGLEKIRHYFTRHYHEFYVRFHHFSTVLPEHLAHRCAELLQLASDHKNRREHAWKQVAYEIYQIRPSGDAVDAVSGMHNPWNGAWRLFQVAQHLGFGHRAMAQLDAGQVYALLEATTGLTQEKRSYLWLCAYELQYRERLFHALLENPHRSYPAPVPERPSLQTVFCMDEREESMRRHLEEMDASIQTFGVAGFFGVAMRFTALGATDSDDLCPVVVKPGHKIEETATGNGHTAARRYVSGLDAERMGNAVMLALPNRGLLRAITGTVLLSPVALLESLGQLLFPSARAHIQSKLADAFYPKPVTRMNIHASAADSQNASLLHSGFTVDEQAARVAGVLRTIGLTRNFAPWVIILGHGSTTSNNPHQAAYHCGACSGRPGGPNARVFAGMANDHEVRAQLLHQYSIEIPPDTRFIGAEHDTCTDEINYFDTEALPNTEHAEWQSRLAFMDRARSLSALERCRRFASASAVTPLDALQHVFRRAFSLNQPRPELGHAGNASAIIGRRAVTRGIFLDRRSFLLSYDCTQDPDGHVLEALLLAATPVGAGINLEYYFSTINNAAFGCGSKVPHNLTGWFGIMEGSSSDLRTGLPQQMVEVHEPMRLLVVVEHYPEIVAQIYQKQPSLQELLGGLWVTLAVLHPEHNTLYEFHPSLGFSKWQDPQAGEALPVAASSLAWCIRSSQLLQPALIHAEYP
jgi:uncharacterized protein YbcC (UPF0753/DUF2309 family)